MKIYNLSKGYQLKAKDQDVIGWLSNMNFQQNNNMSSHKEEVAKRRWLRRIQERRPRVEKDGIHLYEYATCKSS